MREISLEKYFNKIVPAEQITEILIYFLFNPKKKCIFSVFF